MNKWLVASLTWTCVVANAATPVQEYTGVTGAKMVSSGKDGVCLFLFFEMSRTKKAMGKHKDPNIGKPVKLIDPSQTLGGLGKDLSTMARMRLTSLLTGGTFVVSGLARKMEVWKLHLDKKPEKVKDGLFPSFTDYSNAVPLNGPFPDVSPVCDAICNVREEDAPDYFAGVSMLWPTGLSKSKGAVVPMFFRLSTRDSQRWGKKRGFLLYEKIAGNPFARRIGESTRIVDILKTAKQKIVAISASGESVEYDCATNTWGKPYRLVKGTVVSVVHVGAGYLIFWKNRDGQLMSAKTVDMKKLEGEKHEELSCSKTTDITIASDGVIVWAVAIERDTTTGVKKGIGQPPQIFFAYKDKGSSKWNSWAELSSHANSTQPTIDAKAMSINKQMSALYVAVTDRKAKTAKLYFLSPSQSDKQVKPSTMESDSRDSAASKPNMPRPLGTPTKDDRTLDIQARSISLKHSEQKGDAGVRPQPTTKLNPEHVRK